MLAALIVIFGILTRLIIHIPNFTPVIAIALFGGIYLKKNQAVFLPLLIMAVSDIFLGFHETMLPVWGSLVLTSLMGLWVKEHKNWKMILGASILSSILFFVVTNFGTWAFSNLYPRTPEGLRNCFILAIPFFRATLFSTVIYAVILCGAYEWFSARLRQTRFASVL